MISFRIRCTEVLTVEWSEIIILLQKKLDLFSVRDIVGMLFAADGQVIVTAMREF